MRTAPPEIAHVTTSYWEDVASESIASLRAAIGDVDDPRLTDLIGELSLNSPCVGPIALDYEALSINGSEGQTLLVSRAEPGTVDEQALTLLAAMTAENASSSSRRNFGLIAE